jgi:hypothetical protein
VTTSAPTAGLGPAGDALAAAAAIEVLLVWSRNALGGLIGLGELIRYLDGGGPLDVVAPRILREIDRTEAALATFPALCERLRGIAHDAQESPE